MKKRVKMCFDWSCTWSHGAPLQGNIKIRIFFNTNIALPSVHLRQYQNAGIQTEGVILPHELPQRTGNKVLKQYNLSTHVKKTWMFASRYNCIVPLFLSDGILTSNWTIIRVDSLVGVVVRWWVWYCSPNSAGRSLHYPQHTKYGILKCTNPNHTPNLTYK